MDYQNNPSSEGRKDRGRASKPRSKIREDLWAYELIASSNIQPCPSSSRKFPSYYLDAKTLLQKLYPGVHQSWEKFKRDNCGDLCASNMSNSAKGYMNEEYSYPHWEEDNNKNILLLANVADVRQAYESQSSHRKPSGDYSFYDLDGNTCYNSDYCPEDTKSNIKLFPNVTVKSENDSSTYMCI